MHWFHRKTDDFSKKQATLFAHVRCNWKRGRHKRRKGHRRSPRFAVRAANQVKSAKALPTFASADRTTSHSAHAFYLNGHSTPFSLLLLLTLSSPFATGQGKHSQLHSAKTPMADAKQRVFPYKELYSHLLLHKKNISKTCLPKSYLLPLQHT